MNIEEKPFIEITENPFIKIPVYKSELVIGNITIRFTKRFNWFNRLMLKLVFGLGIKNICKKEINNMEDIKEKTADEREVKKCHWCKKRLYEKDIQELSNARGYGYYIICPNCKNKNVIQEIDLTREF